MELRKLRLAMCNLNHFTSNELADVTELGTFFIQDYLNQCTREGLLVKRGDYRYAIKDHDAKIHLLDLNIESLKDYR